MRSQKPYTPPPDVGEQINKILSVSSITDKSKCLELSDKFNILNAFNDTFGHTVPNSQLHEMTNISKSMSLMVPEISSHYLIAIFPDAIILFYNTEVNTTLPLDAMKKMDLPSNLHIQSEYLRFHPETDTMFKGQTAFPKSSTIVSGLKYRKKYKGHVAKTSWP